jgi:hypothetical protein
VHGDVTKSSIGKDVVTLGSHEVGEKLAVSFGLAQSIKLGVFELLVEQTIQETRHIPERMAKDGKIRLKHTEITRRIGQVSHTPAEAPAEAQHRICTAHQRTWRAGCLAPLPRLTRLVRRFGADLRRPCEYQPALGYPRPSRVLLGGR